MVYAGILAGGIGVRMHRTDLPKQYLMLGSKPIIIHTLEQFAICPLIDKIIVVVPYEWEYYTEDLFAKYMPYTNNIEVICGGANKNQSIKKILEHIYSNNVVQDEDIMLCHDAIRPFVTPRIINDNIEAALKYGAVNTVVPTTETVVASTNGKSITDIYPINQTFVEQTPQSFNIGQLKGIYESLSEGEHASETDTTRLVYRCGYGVKLVLGEQSNMKIITPYDLEVANALLKELEK